MLTSCAVLHGKNANKITSKNTFRCNWRSRHGRTASARKLTRAHACPTVSILFDFVGVSQSYVHSTPENKRDLLFRISQRWLVVKVLICNHGRRKGWHGALSPPWSLEISAKKKISKISAKKGCFLSFEWEKTNFTTFGPPRKILEKPLMAPPGKNPSDAHVYNVRIMHTQVFYFRHILISHSYGTVPSLISLETEVFEQCVTTRGFTVWKNLNFKRHFSAFLFDLKYACLFMQKFAVRFLLTRSFAFT